MSKSNQRVPVYKTVDQKAPQHTYKTIFVDINDGAHPYVRSAPAEPESAAAPARKKFDPEMDLYAKVLFALRGRWWLAAVLAIVGGSVGAYFGYRYKPMTFRSEGLIQIAYSRPKVLHDSDQGQSLQMFESHLGAQTQVITSRNVVEQALATPTWAKTGRGNSPRTITEVAMHLSAEHPANTDQIHIRFVDQDPDTAAAAVNSVITAYIEYYNKHASYEGSREFEKQRLAILEDRRQQLSGRLEKLEAQLAEEMAAMTKPAVAPAPNANQRPKPSTNEPTSTVIDPTYLRQLAKNDPVMTEYLNQLTSMDDVLTRLMDTYGQSHPSVVAQRRSMDRLREKIAGYVEQLQAMPAPAPAPAPGQVNPVQPQANPAAATLVMSPRYDRLKTEVTQTRDELTDTIKRIDTLQVENSVGGRINVISAGEVPVIPYADSRVKYAGVGGVGGASLLVGLLVLAGLIGGTYRFSDDAEDDSAGAVPLLGILPMLSENREELEKRADAAHCIHQIRAILQMRRPGQSVYMVTSATAGEGKTSLCASLAFAFAASGARTLLIDADLVGQRLTGGFKCDRIPGLHDLIVGTAMDDCVKRVDRGLRFMPVGRTETLRAWTLSAAEVRTVVELARKDYDVVLVDTGPALGSVEASVVAPEVDGVIFTIARGQQRWLVEKATRHVKNVGGKLIGFVFNRAEARDFNRSAFRSSKRSSTMPEEADWTPRRESPDAERLGPLVTSVATLLPATTHHD